MTGDAAPLPASGRAILFSGHMVDAPGRDKPRFPAALEPAVARAIREEVERLAAGPDDTALSSGACGSDLLFDEAVLDRGVPLRLYLPFDEATFVERSVAFADARWTGRFHDVARRASTFVATDVLGPLPSEADPYERTNLWMLDEATRLGGGRVAFVCVWNGEGGDGPGGTQHMMDAVRGAGGDVHWIDIRRL